MNTVKINADPGKQELFIVREFDAPRELVFKAHTDQKLYTRWLGPNNSKVSFEKFEPFDGGSWRFIDTDTEGRAFGFHGVYHEVTAPERIVGTFEYEGLPERGHVILETTLFEALSGNRTRVTTHSVYRSVEDRDGMIQAGMESGVVEGYNKLDELLKELAVAKI
jgi:uncharacterized protein YndB with AHSA1/START domain